MFYSRGREVHNTAEASLKTEIQTKGVLHFQSKQNQDLFKEHIHSIFEKSEGRKLDAFDKHNINIWIKILFKQMIKITPIISDKETSAQRRNRRRQQKIRQQTK
jgi:hypothetical protein